jgi:uncharacterized protein
VFCPVSPAPQMVVSSGETSPTEIGTRKSVWVRQSSTSPGPLIVTGDSAKATGRLVNPWWAMGQDLQNVLQTLRAHETDLRRLGVAHAAVFGSVARGEARQESDIDVLVELDEHRPMGIFEYARLKLYVNELFDRPSDVVNRRTLKPLLCANILHDMVDAF